MSEQLVAEPSESSQKVSRIPLPYAETQRRTEYEPAQAYREYTVE